MKELLDGIDPLVLNAIYAVVGLGVLDWVLGTIRALANSTFKLELLDVWIRTQLLGRILPIILVLAFSVVIGNITVGTFTLNVLETSGIAAALAYAAVTVKSIVDSVNPSAPDTLPTE